ncbi:MAG: trehalose-phosphatase [Candidatus Omnitrophica bacterium]|jgi:trehalose-phosphatase|nr:trehalose-phosphatase [Candidatus Omnitrophota bacterium]
MKHLSAFLDKLVKVIDGKSIYLFLDYDGTLAPIVDKPEEAFLPKETRELLINLAKDCNCKIAIISGRTINDVKGRVKIKNIIYAGNHGLEIEGPKIKFRARIHPKFLTMFNSIKDSLAKKLSGIKGVFVEDKGLTLSLHYRLVNKKHVSDVKTIFHETVITYLAGDRIRVKSGKMIFEIRPPIDWDKGKAVLWLLSRQQFVNKNKNVLPIYIGDDITDEDAFCAIRNKGLTVFVGSPKESCAEYYLKSTQDVAKLLGRILDHYNSDKQCRN